ncbi:hypothetical protein FRC01_003163 [Tulasnella sp. 417]|nr:hypothetical protein FRC01_003163 [Tulasnella sp. 417]
MDRPQTPPPTASSSRAAAQLTPEQVKRIEINRLKAKARLRATQEASRDNPTSLRNANNKRPLTVIPANNTSPTTISVASGSGSGPNKNGGSEQRDDNAPLKRDAKLMGRYLDYDLSKMVDSRGGFLVDDKAGVDERERNRLLARERERMKQNLDPLCNKCKDEFPEKYSLLTKTECKEDYLLTDPELRDQELLPHLLKANPHHATWNNMMLFLRYQVEDFAWKKWGSPEALDVEYERRANEKRKKKSKKFEDGLKELRRKTREGVWQKRKDEEHIHDFGEVERDEGEGDGVGVQRCRDCGFEIEVEVF